jgi:hypothetical protein
VNGEWTCLRGGMGLSEIVSRGMMDVYVKKSRSSVERPSTFTWGGVWYCPGCGIQLSEHEGLVACGQCGQSLNEFLWQLVELHPHTDGHGNWT